MQSVLYGVPAQRKPALRRADAADALLATDLPLVAEETAVAAFRQKMADVGWRTELRNGWLVLDATIPVPEYVIPAKLEGECGCCISILMRHRDDVSAEEHIRAIVKAADAGKQPLEKRCAQLHGELAARLRQHQPLPGALLPYLCNAYQKLY